jgi:hypothetical protein
MSTPTQTPYDSAIEELEGKIRQFQSVLETLKSLRASQSGDGAWPAVTPGVLRENDAEIRHDSFFGMTIADAARKYLAMVKQTKSTADLAEALEQGGLKHASKNFPMTVRAIMGQREGFVRVNNDWGLTEWYPGIGRGRKAKPEKPARPTRKKKTSEASAPPKKQATAERRPPHHKKKRESEPGSEPIKARILKLLSSNPSQKFDAHEIAEKIQGGAPSVAAALSVLFQDGKVARPETGFYQFKAA